MEYARDLGQVELWEESLRRSLERRGRPRRSSVELHSLRPGRDLTLEDVIERSTHYSQLRRQAAERPAMPRPSLALSGMSALAVAAAAALPNVLRGHGGAVKQHAEVAADTLSTPGQQPARTVAQQTHFTRRIPQAHRARAVRHQVRRPTTPSVHPALAPAPAARATAPAPRAIVATTRQAAPATHTSGGVGLAPTPHKRTAPSRTRSVTKHTTPRPTSNSATGGVGVKVQTTSQHTTTRPSPAPPATAGGYLNPLARAHVTPERIDQGVDYSGSGTLSALGAGRVTYVATSGTGWPGAFIEYRLTSGADAGRYVFYAEHVAPVAGLRVGEALRAGQPVAAVSGGIEVGWGAGIGTETYARANGQWPSGADARNYASPSGRSFSALIASLGGPAGKAEG